MQKIIFLSLLTTLVTTPCYSMQRVMDALSLSPCQKTVLTSEPQRTTEPYDEFDHHMRLTTLKLAILSDEERKFSKNFVKLTKYRQHFDDEKSADIRELHRLHTLRIRSLRAEKHAFKQLLEYGNHSRCSELLEWGVGVMGGVGVGSLAYSIFLPSLNPSEPQSEHTINNNLLLSATQLAIVGGTLATKKLTRYCFGIISTALAVADLRSLKHKIRLQEEIGTSLEAMLPKQQHLNNNGIM